MPKATNAKRERPSPLTLASFHTQHMPGNALGINFCALPAGWAFKKPIVRAIEVMAAVLNNPIPYEEFNCTFARLYPEERKRNTANIKDSVNQMRLHLKDGVRHTVPVEERVEYCGYKCTEEGFHVLCKSNSGNDGKGRKSKREIVVWFDDTSYNIYHEGKTIFPKPEHRVKVSKKAPVTATVVTPASPSTSATSSSVTPEPEADVDAEGEMDIDGTSSSLSSVASTYAISQPSTPQYTYAISQPSTPQYHDGSQEEFFATFAEPDNELTDYQHIDQQSPLQYQLQEQQQIVNIFPSPPPEVTTTTNAVVPAASFDDIDALLRDFGEYMGSGNMGSGMASEEQIDDSQINIESYSQEFDSQEFDSVDSQEVVMDINNFMDFLSQC